MKSKLMVLTLVLVMWNTGSRAQQTPTATPSDTAATQANNPAVASISGTISDAKSGAPLRRASVTLRQSNGNRGNQGGRGNNQIPDQLQALLNGGLPGQTNPGGQGTPTTGGQNGNGGRGGQQGQQGAQGQRGGPGGQPNQPGGNLNRGNNQVTTGDDGTYSFLNVNPGQYQVVVERDGFISQEYGQRSWVSGTGATLTVATGQKLTGISVSMVPAGTIAGRVRDETGEPVAGIQVQALSYQYQNDGTKTLVTARQVQTDDLGAYRLYWLTPGDYFISAIPNGPGGRRGQAVQSLAGVAQAAGLTQVAGLLSAAGAAPAVEEAYAPTYFPGGFDPENAVAVNVPPAQDVGGMDFILRPVQMVTVSGKITPVDPATIPLTEAQQAAQQRQQAAQAQQGNRGGRGGNNNNNNGGGRGNFNVGGVNVILTRIGPSTNGGRGGGGRGGNNRGGGGFGGPGQPRAIVNPDGTYQISNVIPGSYNLTAIQQASGKTFTARTKVEVGFANVANINLAVSPGADIKGQIATEDGKSPTNFRVNNVRVQLSPTEDDVPVGNAQAQVQADGTFSLTGVPAMSYKLSFSGINGGYVISGKYGNIDVLNEPFQVDPGQTGSSLSVQLGFQPGTLSGTVTDSKGQPFQAATAVLIPNSRNRTDLYKNATSDQNGKFNLSNIAPGDYKLFVWESIPAGAYHDAAYIRPFEDKGKPVTIGKSASVPVQLNVIPATQQ